MPDKALIQALNQVLAETYALYLDTQTAHWNVAGPEFAALHNLFESQYTELADAIDEIAERIRIIGALVPANLRKFADLSSLTEYVHTSNSNDILKHLCTNHTQIMQTLNSALACAHQATNEVSIDLLVQRLRFHEKTHWMLQASLTQ